MKAANILKKAVMSKRGGDSGFALLELMVALLILTFGIVAFMRMQMTTIETNAFARRMTERTMLGTDRMEKLMGLPYDDPQLQPGSSNTVKDGKYTIKWVVSAADNPVKNVKTINVITSWVEKGETRSMTYVYYKADKI